MKRYLMEFIGTFFLLLAIATGNAIAMGVMLAALVYIGWHISGANYNPAVTTAVCISSKMKTEDYLYYICAQILGALAGIAFWYFTTGQKWTMQPSGAPVWMVLCFEAVLAFLLCAAYLASAELLKKKSVSEYGLIIGAAFMAIAFLRGIVNPAVVFASFLFCVIMGGGSGGMFMPLLGYIIGPFIGAWLAARAHKHLNK